MVGWHNQYNDVLPSDGSLSSAPGQGLSAYPNVSWNAGGGGVPYHNLNQFEPVPGGACTGPNNTNLCPVPSWTSGGPTGQIARQTYNRYVAGSTLTYLFEGLGHHVVKFGVSAEFTSYDHVKGHSGGTNIIESAQGQLSDAEHFGVLSGPDNPSPLEPFHITTKSLIAGGFVQDSWSILDKVTLNVGLRYDVQEMYAGNGAGFGLHLCPTSGRRGLGVVYDPTQEGRSKIFASYARYFENVPLGLADGAISGEPSDALHLAGAGLHRRRRQSGPERVLQATPRAARPATPPVVGSPTPALSFAEVGNVRSRCGHGRSERQADHRGRGFRRVRIRALQGCARRRVLHEAVARSLVGGHEPRQPLDVLHRKPGLWHRQRLPEGAAQLRRRHPLPEQELRRRVALERELHALVSARGEHHGPLRPERRASTRITMRPSTRRAS